jgi:uncharacterized protein (DUF488 family)
LRDVTKRLEELRTLKQKLMESKGGWMMRNVCRWSMSRPFYTIGHSTRSIEEFVELLRPQKIKLVVDVRSVPRSRTNPQYNAEKLAKTLSAFQIGYEHIAALGGLRGRKPNVPASVNAFWENKSFHNYADYARSEEFRFGLARLRELGNATTSAMMCAEAVWWRCHRRIVADYLIAAGETVFHILGANHVAAARVTPGAVLEKDGTVSYPGSLESSAEELHQTDN